LRSHIFMRCFNSACIEVVDLRMWNTIKNFFTNVWIYEIHSLIFNVIEYLVWRKNIDNGQIILFLALEILYFSIISEKIASMDTIDFKLLWMLGERLDLGYFPSSFGFYYLLIYLKYFWFVDTKMRIDKLIIYLITHFGIQL